MRRLATSISALTLFACTGKIGAIDEPGPGPTQRPPPPPIPIDTSCPQVIEVGEPSTEWAPIGLPGGNVTAASMLTGDAVLIGTGATRGAAGRPLLAAGIYRSDDGRTYEPALRVLGTTVRSLVAGARVWAAISAETPAAEDGVYVSDDDGRSFVLASEGLFTGARVRRLVIGPDETIYALIEGQPLDPGAAVTLLYARTSTSPFAQRAAVGLDPTIGGPVRGMTIEPGPSGRLLLVDGSALYASSDGGRTFVPRVLSEIFPEDNLGPINGVHADPDAPGRILIATDDRGLWQSSDGGLSFLPADGIAGVPITDVAFAAGRTIVTTRGSGLYVRGPDEARYTSAGRCLLDPQLSVVAAASDRVIVGTHGAGALFSSDGAVTFSPASAGVDEILGRVQIVGGEAWLMSAAGLFRLSPDRRRWSRVELGPQAPPVADVMIDPANPERLLIATDEDVYPVGGPGQGVLWLDMMAKTITPATGFTGHNVAKLAVDPADPSRLYAYQRRGTKEAPTSTGIGVFQSTDGGSSFASTSIAAFDTYPAYPFSFMSSPMIVSPAGTLLAGGLVDATPTAAVWRAPSDGGMTMVWTNGDDLDLSRIGNGVYVDPSGRIYLAGRYQGSVLLASDDDGVTFAPASDGLDPALTSVLDVAFGDDGAIAVASGPSVQLAVDGQTFGSTGELNRPYAVAILPGDPAILFVSTAGEGVLWKRIP